MAPFGQGDGPLIFCGLLLLLQTLQIQSHAKRSHSLQRTRFQFRHTAQKLHTCLYQSPPEVTFRQKSSDQPADDRTIFVGRLPPVVTDRDMYAAFEPYGEIENVYVAKSGTVSRGFGFVEFATAAEARKILKDRPLVRMGPYTLVLRPAIPRVKERLVSKSDSR